MIKLILASTSESRKKILSQFAIPFQCIAPNCDETPKPNESAIDLVLRLSYTKAQSVSQQYPDCLVIGSDQVGVLNGEIIGKPRTVENAIKQLQNSSGKIVDFYTGLSVIHQKSNQITTIYEHFKVKFRTLTLEEIMAYINKDQPLYCAGSFKCDGLGITLFEQLEGNDINALIGLPLIQLNQIMIKMGFNPLTM